jgi:hypothetical protein
LCVNCARVHVRRCVCGLGVWVSGCLGVWVSGARCCSACAAALSVPQGSPGHGRALSHAALVLCAMQQHATHVHAHTARIQACSGSLLSCGLSGTCSVPHFLTRARHDAHPHRAHTQATRSCCSSCQTRWPSCSCCAAWTQTQTQQRQTQHKRQQQQAATAAVQAAPAGLRHGRMVAALLRQRSCQRCVLLVCCSGVCVCVCVSSRRGAHASLPLASHTT